MILKYSILVFAIAIKETWCFQGYSYADSPSDLFQEYFNILDGDSIGIGPMHDFVFGWQSKASKMSMKNNVETRKRAGLQRFALAGINGITFIENRGVNEILINGTRTFCHGDVIRPPISPRSVLCSGYMYQEKRFDCKTPYIRYGTLHGDFMCVDKYAIVTTPSKGLTRPYCAKGEAISKHEYEYMCERMNVRVKHVNYTDIHDRKNIRNPVVRRVEYYRSPNDFLKKCSDWYGCDIEVRASEIPDDYETKLYVNRNETQYVATGGPFWVRLMHTKLSQWAPYFQPHTDYPWSSYRPVTDKNWIQSIISFLNVQALKSNMHYNLQGIGPRGHILLTDYMKSDPEVMPENIQQNFYDSVETMAHPDGADFEPLHLFRKFNHRSRFNPNYANLKKK